MGETTLKLSKLRITDPVALLAISTIMTSTSFAQENTTSEVDFTLEEIIVTATRRTETLQDVPISISVMSAGDIQATNSADLRDISSHVPNFVFAESNNIGQGFTSIRGIFSVSDPGEIGFDQNVGIYVDGVYFPRQFSANANMGEVERVEVLRGPQGTLFGRNTISGAVNITSKKANMEELEGQLYAETGNYGLTHGKGSISIPLIEDKLAVRFFGESREIDGWIDNLTTGKDDQGSRKQTNSRMQVRYTPSENTTVDFSVASLDAESLDYFYEHIEGGSNDNKKFSTANNYDNESDLDLFNASLQVEHNLDNGYTLTSITAWLDDEMTFAADVEGMPFPLVLATNSTYAEQFSQEIRIASPTDRNYDFVAGVYYDREESTFVSDIYFGPFFPAPPAQNQGFANGNAIDRESWAAFVHANYDITEDLALFGGLRYTSETKDQTINPSTCTDSFACLILGVPETSESLDIPFDVELDDWTFTAGVRYEISESAMLYSSVATGIKGGAFNNSTDPERDIANNNLFTEPEKVTSFEVGVKTSWLSNRITANFALFYMEYDDLQVKVGCSACGDGGLPENSITNAADAVSQGFELELSAAATESLTFSLGAGYNESEYGSFERAIEKRTDSVVDVSGKYPKR
ncbi:MAG TPA: TonB-dependent receptor [Porticoccus sp.]|nr:TonB-dependent receptor [Porticoccus sp.]